MAGNTTWTNWPMVLAKIEADKGVEPAPRGPHGMREGLTYTVAGNIAGAQPGRTRHGNPVVRFSLRRKAMEREIEPLPCIAFSGAAERLADFVRTHGPDQPVCLIGRYEREKQGDGWRFLVAQSRLPTLHLAINNAVRLGERFEHCS